MPTLKVKEADWGNNIPQPAEPAKGAEAPVFSAPTGESGAVTFSDPTVAEAAQLATAHAAEVINVPVQVQDSETNIQVKQG